MTVPPDVGQDALQLEGVCKAFGRVQVLKSVSFHVKPGSIHGLVGANGAGKSTLIKILSGVEGASEGFIRIWGEEVTFPYDPYSVGVATVHQDLGLVGSLTVLENVLVVSRFGSTRGRPIRWSELRHRVGAALAEFGIHAPLDEPVERLEPSVRAGVAVVRALDAARHIGSDRLLLLLDEPTVYSSAAQKEALFAIIRRVAASGHSVVFVSHRLNEVFEVCDSVSVLRDGRVMLTCESTAITEAELVETMLGYSLSATDNGARSATGEAAVLEVIGANCLGLSELTLGVMSGEIVGVTGPPGAGHEKLAELLSGVLPLRGGTIRVGAEVLTSRVSAQAMLEAGVVVVPADRLRLALWAEGTCQENFTVGRLKEFTVRGQVSGRSERLATREWSERLGVSPSDPGRIVSTLSGGNQQRLVLARALSRQPRVLVLHEATQGVDVRGKHEILGFADDARNRGLGVLMISSDHEELARVCDRVLVFGDGRVKDELSGGDLTEGGLVARCS